MTLPEPLRQQLGRLKEQGCPAALIERAMGMELPLAFKSTAHWYSTVRLLEIRVDDLVYSGSGITGSTIGFLEDGSVSISTDTGVYTIPAPKGAA